jgi:hypothetical protein
MEPPQVRGFADHGPMAPIRTRASIDGLTPDQLATLDPDSRDRVRQLLQRRAQLHGVALPAKAWPDPNPMTMLRRIAPQMFTHELMWFHEAFWEHIWNMKPGVRPDPLAFFVSRNFGKSAMLELATILLGGTRRRKYAVYVCATQELADDHTASIAAVLESSLLAAEWPDLADRKVSKFGNSKGWRRNRLWTRAGLVVDGMGLDVAARGRRLEEQRPDLLCLDDVDSSADTPDIALKKLRTVTKTLLPMGAPDLAVIFVQNLISEWSLASRVARPEQFAVGERLLENAKVIGPVKAIEGLTVEREVQPDGRTRHRIVAGTSNWPDRLPLPVLENLLNESNLADFNSEYQHDTSPPAGGIFDHIVFQHVPWVDVPWSDIVQTEVWVDPTVTAKDSSDSVGIVAMAVDKRGLIYVLWSIERIMTVTEAIHSALLLGARVRARKVGVETNMGGDLWLAEFRHEADALVRAGKLDKGWAGNARFDEKKAGAYESKVERASRTVPDFDHGLIRLVMTPASTHLTLERALRRFPKTQPWDLVDAFSWGHFSLRAMVPAPDMERVHGLGVGEGARWTPPSGDQRRQPSEGQSLWSAPSLNGASQGGPAGGRWSM